LKAALSQPTFVASGDRNSALKEETEDEEKA